MEPTKSNCNFCFIDDLKDLETVNGYSDKLPKLQIKDVVTKYFWFTADQLQSFSICSQCWDKLLDFHQFYCRVEQLYAPKKPKEQPSDAESDRDCMEYETEMISVKVELQENQPDETEDAAPEDDNLDNDDDSTGDASPEVAEKKRTNQASLTNEEILLYCELNCPYCTERFDDPNKLMRHCKSVHKQKGYMTCCNRKFSHPRRLREHIKVHRNPMTFQCPQCEKSFSSKRSLQSHESMMHLSDDLKMFQCEHCPKKFAKPGQLTSHTTRHKAEKNFPCPQCDRTYFSAGTLKFHVKDFHEKAFRVMCDICSKMLRNKSALEEHRAEHLDPRRLQCTVCSNWMKNAKSLRNHMKLHEEVTKVFVCNICGKKSPNSHALKKHIKDVHTSQRIHQCTICERAFKRAIALKEHMATHTGVTLYDCNFCDSSFNSAANLSLHRKKTHPVEWQEYQQRKPIISGDQ